MLSPAFTFIPSGVLFHPAKWRLFAFGPLVCRGNFSPHFATVGLYRQDTKKELPKAHSLNFRESHIGKLIFGMNGHSCRGPSITNVGSNPTTII